MGDNRPCYLFDLEAVYKGVQEVWSVNSDGDIQELRETYGDESELAYYFCKNCEQDWTVTAVQSEAAAWKLAKAHLTELTPVGV